MLLAKVNKKNLNQDNVKAVMTKIKDVNVHVFDLSCMREEVGIFVTMLAKIVKLCWSLFSSYSFQQ